MPPFDGRGVIDIQTHYVPPAAARLLERTKADGLAANMPRDAPMFGLDGRLKAMDAAEVELSVLSLAPLGIIAEADLRRDICQAANDGLLAACDAHPDRFVMAAALPLPDVDDAQQELARIANEDALRAIQIVAQTTGYRPETGFDDLFELAADAHLPVILHPAAGIADLSLHFNDFGLASGMHAMISHSLVAARMIQSGLLDRIPDLELILTHLGGILPFLIDRIDSRNTGPGAHPPSHYLRHRIHFDICGYPAGPALRCALATLGHERLLVGSDWPSRPIDEVLTALLDLGLATDAEHAILRGNAARWFDPAVPRRQ